MLAAYNLIGLVSNNGNQNNNNDINNNNDNNNNNQNVNEATTDTMNMNMGMVMLPPLPPGRMLNLTQGRQARLLGDEQRETSETASNRGCLFIISSQKIYSYFLQGPQWSPSPDENKMKYFWTKEHHHESAVVIIELLKTWIRKET